ncbi:hypothetical protein K469DRAFT_585432, partial [Zopfia rhizophila CBS 207.26]
VSLIEAISVHRKVINLMLIIKALIILKAWVINLSGDYLINVSNSSYNNNKISLD